jgi:L-rhamnose mutarotase
MELVGNVWRVKPGKADEYLERHKTIWPELAQVLRDAGVREYAIYLLGDLVFSHMLVDNYASMAAKVGQTRVSALWEEQFKDILEYPGGDRDTGWPARAVTVWELNRDNPPTDDSPGQESQ